MTLTDSDKQGKYRDNFPCFSIKTSVVTPHQDSSNEGHSMFLLTNKENYL